MDACKLANFGTIKTAHGDVEAAYVWSEMIHDTHSAHISQKQDGLNIYAIKFKKFELALMFSRKFLHYMCY